MYHIFPMNLPPEIYICVFHWLPLRLHDIINLMTVSKNFHRTLLLETFWHTIIDRKAILYDFIRKVFQSEFNISYPVKKIQKMYAIDELDHLDLLPIVPHEQKNFIQFYEYFTDYRYLYMADDRGFESHKDMNVPLCGICIYGFYFKVNDIFKQNLLLQKIITVHTITEIIALSDMIDCQLLIKYCPQIEKIEANSFYNIEYLKQTKLKYLCLTGDIKTNVLAQNLPDTIESLSITRGLRDATIFNQLSSFSNLKYLNVKLFFDELKTTLNINTIHFDIGCNGRIIGDCRINVPYATNIIISGYCYCHIGKLHLIAPNAISCKIVSIEMHDSNIFLPKCPKVDMIDKIWKNPYDSDIFELKNSLCQCLPNKN
jgi:hypothetical protein